MIDEDPRALLERLIQERRDDYAGLSRLLGRNPAYVQQFIKRGVPRKLAENDRAKLARYFDIDEQLLGGPAREPATTATDLLPIARYRVSAAAGHATTADGDEALILIDEIKPDLVILDWMIEGVSGIEVCRRLRRGRQTSSLPIIMLTARGDEEDRVRALDTGADDFVGKPFSPKELVARANALLRRSQPNLVAERLSYAGIEMDVAAHRVRRDGNPVALGPTEYRLLQHFLRNPERVFSRQQLLNAVWTHNEDVELRTVDVLIRRLRLALGEGPDLLRTVRSEGYSLDAGNA